MGRSRQARTVATAVVVGVAIPLAAVVTLAATENGRLSFAAAGALVVVAVFWSLFRVFSVERERARDVALVVLCGVVAGAVGAGLLLAALMGAIGDLQLGPIGTQ